MQAPDCLFISITEEKYNQKTFCYQCPILCMVLLNQNLHQAEMPPVLQNVNQEWMFNLWLQWWNKYSSPLFCYITIKRKNTSRLFSMMALPARVHHPLCYWLYTTKHKYGTFWIMAYMTCVSVRMKILFFGPRMMVCCVVWYQLIPVFVFGY